MVDPEALVGKWRRFGQVGPVYQVTGIGDRAPDGDRLMIVRVLETGESVEYRLQRLLEDPVEA